jgi:hypothetical protein
MHHTRRQFLQTAGLIGASVATIAAAPGVGDMDTCNAQRA